ncbi:DUF4232 domain-containing protein [Actinomadura macrotermitis]|uniref:DUF4232 domain-containing protein n=1 Tax=Actinomadura macrotermitis TaxID=2585200 RepID=A0A7K0BTU5_9ACTN|nr:DUF4232 domain-containing protein [Actinomadura macrotermitis]MQY04589.1 hypothetical protein [Actinomadura macrotermitis]
MNRRVILCVAAGAALGSLITGCRAGDSGPLAGPTTEPDRTTTGSGQRATSGHRPVAGLVTRCHTSGLRGRFGTYNSAAGLADTDLIITNVSGASCRVQGWPGLGSYNASGDRLLGTVKRIEGPGAGFTLRPGASASAQIRWSLPPRVDGAAEAIAPYWLNVIPPDETTSLRLRWSFGTVGMNGAMEITPFRPA